MNGKRKFGLDLLKRTPAAQNKCWRKKNLLNPAVKQRSREDKPAVMISQSRPVLASPSGDGFAGIQYYSYLLLYIFLALLYFVSNSHRLVFLRLIGFDFF